jgi:hypothetical protein
MRPPARITRSLWDGRPAADTANGSSSDEYCARLPRHRYRAARHSLRRFGAVPRRPPSQTSPFCSTGAAGSSATSHRRAPKAEVSRLDLEAFPCCALSYLTFSKCDESDHIETRLVLSKHTTAFRNISRWRSQAWATLNPQNVPDNRAGTRLRPQRTRTPSPWGYCDPRVFPAQIVNILTERLSTRIASIPKYGL